MTKATGPKRTKLQREADFPVIAKLYLAGNTQAQIAEQLSAMRGYAISQQQISSDIKAVRKQWVKETTMALDEAKALELVRIDALEREYWEAWEASKKPRKRVSRKDSGEDKNSDITMQTEDRTGDPRYLAGVQWCIQQRCKILGIEAPQRSENQHAGDMVIKLAFPDATGGDDDD